MRNTETTLFTTPRFSVVKSTVEDREYYYIRKPDAVVTVALTRSRSVVLLRAKRANIPDALWELPGGRMEPDETAEEAAARELIEETGLRLKVVELKKIGSIHPLPSVTTEVVHIFEAETDLDNLSATEETPAHEGILEVRAFTAEELVSLALNGQVSSGIDGYAILLSLARRCRHESSRD